MIDFRLTDGQLTTDRQGNLRCVDGAERVRQQIEFRLSLFRGEWFLDGEFGTPYFSDILGKQVNINAALSVIKQQILEVDGVTKITDFSYRLDNKTRTLSVNCDIHTDYGIVNYP